MRSASSSYSNREATVADLPAAADPAIHAGEPQPASHRAVVAPRRDFKSLALAILLFLLQTLPFFSYRWLTDESWYAGPGLTISHWNGVSDPGMGPNEPEHTFDSRPPGTALVMAGFFRLFGVSPVTARLGSLFAGLGSILLVYFLLRDVLGEKAAVLATLITATDNLIVLTARTARPEALTTVSVLLGLWALKRYAQRGTLGWAVGCGLLMAMGTMFHITLLGFIVSFGLLMIGLDLRNRRFPLRGVATYMLGYAVGLLPYIVWIGAAGPVGRSSFRAEFLARAAGTSWLTKLTREASRYSDLLGFGMLHGHGLASVPVRLPIPLVFLTASVVLWRFRRSWFYVELVLLIPTVLWLIYTANKSSRYLVLLAPLFAMVIAASVASLRERPRAAKTMTGLASLVILAQVGANLFLLNAARKANYNKVGEELRSVIPPGATAYGTITFWLALRDRNYISYERTDPQMAAQDFHARYFIVGDPMMAKGSAWESDYYQNLNQRLFEIESKGRMIAEFPSAYYGDLKVYELP